MVDDDLQSRLVARFCIRTNERRIRSKRLSTRGGGGGGDRCVFDDRVDYRPLSMNNTCQQQQQRQSIGIEDGQRELAVFLLAELSTFGLFVGWKRGD